jgi:hypothetical protein
MRVEGDRNKQTNIKAEKGKEKKRMKVRRLILSCSKWRFASSLLATNEGRVTLLSVMPHPKHFRRTWSQM